MNKVKIPKSRRLSLWRHLLQTRPPEDIKTFVKLYCNTTIPVWYASQLKKTYEDITKFFSRRGIKTWDFDKALQFFQKNTSLNYNAFVFTIKIYGSDYFEGFAYNKRCKQWLKEWETRKR